MDVDELRKINKDAEAQAQEAIHALAPTIKEIVNAFRKTPLEFNRLFRNAAWGIIVTPATARYLQRYGYWYDRSHREKRIKSRRRF